MNKLLTTALLLLLAVTGCKKNQTFNPIVGASEYILPMISAIEPSIVTVNSIVTITGANFGTTKTGLSVKFNGVEASIQSVTDTEIKVVVPFTGSGNIYLTLNDKTIKGPEYTFQVAPEQPMASIISPNTVTAGTVATIGGANFDPTGTIKVWMNGVEAAVQSATNREIKVLVPVTTSGNVVITSGSNTFQGPAYSYYGAVTISKLLPEEGPASTTVTLTGANFGTDLSRVQVFFNDIRGSIQTITDTEIKVTVPVTTTGKVKVVIGDQQVLGPVFTFLSPLTSTYAGGSVQFRSQAEVDAFVALNKGKQLQITGSLIISGADIRSVSGLSNIVSITNGLTITASPLLTDLSFLNGITTVGGGITLTNLVATRITMDNLTGTSTLIDVKGCTNLQALGFKSLEKVVGNVIIGGIKITGSSQLSDLDFRSLKEAPYGISVSGTNLIDFSKFNALKTVGKLTIANNASLTSLKGLENLTSLSLPAYTKGPLSGAIINGLKIGGNPKLVSLEALRNLGDAPLIEINQNQSLNELCPIKTLLIRLSTTPNYVFRSNSLDLPRQMYDIPALTLTSNGSYATKADALKALEDCK